MYMSVFSLKMKYRVEQLYCPFSDNCFYIKNLIRGSSLTENTWRIPHDKGQMVRDGLEYKCKALEGFNTEGKTRQSCLVLLALNAVNKYLEKKR